MPEVPKDRKMRGGVIVATACVVALVSIVVLAQKVVNDLGLLASAESDNVQWMMSQSEVEFLEFANRVNFANTTAASDLKEVRQRFDVFYSRIQTLLDANPYEQLQQKEVYRSSLDSIEAFLGETVPLIDADDGTLRAALPQIEASAKSLRPIVRQLSKSGLGLFAQSSDQRRTEISDTLFQLAVVMAGLTVALIAAVGYLSRLNVLNRRRQQEISEAATRTNTIIDTSLDGMIVSDADGRILEFNSAAEAIFGYHVDDVLGKDLGEVIVPDHLREAHDAGMKRMQDGGEKRVVGHGRVKLEAKRQDGSIFPVELAIQSAETAEGEIFIAFLRDISSRVKAEEELVAARDKALAGERAKSEFLATMSHEIRTPLNGLLGNLSLLSATDLTADQASFVENMEKSGQLLRNHVSDVLDISRYEAGKLSIKSEPVHLVQLVQDTIDMQASSARKNGTSINWSWVGEQMEWVNTDRNRLQHILTNLIGNAVKFTHDGLISVRIEASRSKGEGLSEIKFLVGDTGTGIAPELQHRIFEDFVTGDRAYDRSVDGTGLGLSIAKRFVSAMDGEIGLAHSSSAGTTFWFTIPVTEAEPVSTVQAQELALPEQAPLNVLVVEDNEINRFVTSRMLQSFGHKVTEAHDGKIGADLADKTRFDVILMDISMPVMDGRTATKKIRMGSGMSSKVPIIALTANALAEEEQAFLGDGMNGVLTKPLQQEALHKALAEISLDEHDSAAPSDDNGDNSAKAFVGDDAYAILMKKFIDEVEGFIDWLPETADEQDEIRDRAHKVAGSAAVFGATALREKLKALENEAKSRTLSDLETHRRELLQTWEATRSTLTS